jgi:SPP1 gp7 family putative phage head morphogenesis protein
MPNINYGTLPFDEAIDFIRDKIDLPTKTWSDITNDMHGRAFVVAGAMKQEIVSDFHSAILKAVTDGTDIAQFRKDFDSIVENHGWTYNGKRGWRSSVILDTNLSTAYSAGREKQRRAESVIAAFPNNTYRTMDDSRVRPLHQSWNGVTLPWNDPWWSTHQPPNGYGCRCWTEPSAGTPDKVAPDNGFTEWKNPATGQVESIPAGIDPGFAYNPADAAWGREMNCKVADEDERDTWTPIQQRHLENYNRPAKVPLDAVTTVPYANHATTEDVLRKHLQIAIGGESKTYNNPIGEMVLISQGLCDHIMKDAKNRLNKRDRYFPFIQTLIEDPYEIWVNFEKNDRTGKVRARQRYIKGLAIDGGKSVSLVLEVVKNMWTNLTFYASDKLTQNNVRAGWLMYGRKL